MRYEDVVPRLVEQCERTPGFEGVTRGLVVRAPDGRVRLALRGGGEALRVALGEALSADLGAWFAGPVISTDCGPRALQKVAAELLQGQAPWPAGWPTTVRRADGTDAPLGDRWGARQVVRGKEVFLDPTETRPAWPLKAKAPRITAFYGFKGGVGRTTTLAVVAWNLAASGKRVVVVDLDLESPGLGRALGADGGSGGVLDYLLGHAVAGTAELPGQEVTLHGATLVLVAAGRLDDGLYVEKLARLDVVHRDGAGTSPVLRALRSLLNRLRSQHHPDHILLDCRSGLHDLAGLALHDLAHVDVFVGRGDRQELDGLRPLLAGWMARRAEEDRRLLVLRTQRRLPLDESQTVRHRIELHELLASVGYLADEDPGASARGLPHDPCPVGHQEEIANAANLGEVDPTVFRHASFDGVLARLELLWT